MIGGVDHAYTAFNDEKKKSVWYSSKKYRINLYSDEKGLRIRDLHIFNEKFPDVYDYELSVGNTAHYYTLPLIDGNLFSGNGTLSGGFISKKINADNMKFNELKQNVCEISFNDFKFTLSEDRVRISSTDDFELKNVIGKLTDELPVIKSRTNTTLNLSYKSFNYSVKLSIGTFLNNTTVKSKNGIIELIF